MSINNKDERLQRILGFLSNRWLGLSEKRKSQIWAALALLITSRNKYRKFKNILGRQKNLQHIQSSRLGSKKKIEERITAKCPSIGDWNQFTPRAISKNTLIDVIVPVYEGYDETLRCIFSILSSKNNIPYELIVINDKSPNEKLIKDLKTLSENGLFSFFENNQNLGFVKTTNFGMSLHKERDVIWLNSDTEVFDYWIDRLWEMAQKNPLAASITPLSNNATICSYPLFCQDNWSVTYPDDRIIDELAQQVNSDVLIETPTGVGFCMFVRRRALDIAGLLDEENLGKGYGEENDLCQRFEKKGFKNFIYPGMFVRHYGATSFQNESEGRKSVSMVTLDKLHPSYRSKVRTFVKEDPLEKHRVRLDCARLDYEKRAGTSALKEGILIIAHKRGGGTEKFIQRIKAQEELDSRVVYILRPTNGNKVSLEVSAKDFPNLTSISISYGKDSFREVLRILKIEKIHLNSWVDFPENFTDFLLDIVEDTNIQLAVTLHDYHCICPKISLFKDGKLCGETFDLNRCNFCCKKDGTSPVWAKRQATLRLLKKSTPITVPSQDMKRRLTPVFPDIDFKVLPHYDPPTSFTPRYSRCFTPISDSLNLAVIGSINEQKGYNVIKKLASTKGKHRILLIGHSCNDQGLENIGVTITGRYSNEAQVDEEIFKNNIDCIFIPSVVCETYSYTLSIALRTGLPVFCFSCGAPAERLEMMGLSSLILPLELQNEPELLWKQIQERIKKFTPYVFKGNDTHWTEYFLS